MTSSKEISVNNTGKEDGVCPTGVSVESWGYGTGSDLPWRSVGVTLEERGGFRHV